MTGLIQLLSASPGTKGDVGIIGSKGEIGDRGFPGLKGNNKHCCICTCEDFLCVFSLFLMNHTTISECREVNIVTPLF